MTAVAEDNQTVIRLHLKNGATPTYVLGKDTRITFANANMCFSDTDYAFEVPLTDIMKWTYEEQIASVGNVVDNGVTISRNGDIIAISGLEPGVDVTVYAIDGKLTHSGSSISAVYVMDASGWTAGMYVIKAGNSSFKIVKL